MIDLMLVSIWEIMMNFHLLILSMANFVDMMILQALCIVLAYFSYVLHYVKIIVYNLGMLGSTKLVELGVS